jgi:alpha-1,3-glucosyltransferase
MRLTVLAADAGVYFPAALAAAAAFGRSGPQRLLVLAAMLFNPALVLIDHGHFQYNCIGLGLAAGAAAAVARRRHLLGAALFAASLNHKQMGLYFAPAFFAHLLGRCRERRGAAARARLFAALAAVVAATFALAWAPYLSSPADADAVLRRLFPAHRGLYEDYVANFWCATSPAAKWRRRLPAARLVPLAAAATAAAFLPSAALQVWRPSPRGLLLAMANSGLAFFLFSFQVHEKSVLLPLLPLTMLAADHADAVAWLAAAAPFSMLPLLKKDGLTLAYLATTALCGGAVLALRPAAAHGWGSAAADAAARAPLRRAAAASVAAMGALQVAGALVAPPTRYPFLFDAAVVTWAFLHFAALFAHTNVAQWREAVAAGRAAEEKKRA